MTKITKADRDAASRYWGNDNPPQELQREFARHRLDERAKIIAWLSDQPKIDDCIDMETEDMCAAIQSGMHRK